ncbi:MAG: glycosyl hydrolase family 18 protein [Bacilli bacterium]|nr:glycosyl hydrolase family 18 protein [Bacilli bacterium]
MRRYHQYFIMIILFFLVLCGCNKYISDEGNDKGNSVIPTLSVELDSFLLNVEATAMIVPIVSGIANLTILFNSTNPDIAIVNNDGLITAVSEGQTLINVYLNEYPEVKTTVTVVVIDWIADAEREARKNIEKAIIELEGIIPSEICNNIILPRFAQNYSVTLTWSSSNPDVISTAGAVIRKKQDQFVELEAKIVYNKFSIIEGVFKKTVKVEKYQLKDIDNKKPIFAYLYNDGFQLRDEDLDKIDVINYSFAYVINSKLSISHLSGISNAINKAHSKGTRFVLSVGGWGASGFSKMAESEENRVKFIQSVIEIIDKYSIDGIDLDWEYPTTGSGNDERNSQDKFNFTSLICELRIALDQISPDLLLTVAFPASRYAANNYYEITKINQHLDYLHLMTYDLIDYSTLITSHHANLYTSGYSSSNQASADAAVKAYVNAGADKDKITIGGAFYGHIGTVTENSKEDGMKVSSEGLTNAITYAKIHTEYLNNLNFKYYFDDVAKAPWLFDGTTFITYDDPTSLAYKCEYVINQGLAGIMFWQLGGDYQSILVNTIYENLNE